jgi:hypothetical protein
MPLLEARKRRNQLREAHEASAGGGLGETCNDDEDEDGSVKEEDANFNSDAEEEVAGGAGCALRSGSSSVRSHNLSSTPSVTSNHSDIAFDRIRGTASAIASEGGVSSLDRYPSVPEEDVTPVSPTHRQPLALNRSSKGLFLKNHPEQSDSVNFAIQQQPQQQPGPAMSFSGFGAAGGERILSPSKLPAESPFHHQNADASYRDEEIDDDEEEEDERPTDYSLKFPDSEDQEATAATAAFTAPHPAPRGINVPNNVEEDEEEELDDEVVKTFYTEGTPLDTPFHASTATSMSDLRDLDDGNSCSPPKGMLFHQRRMVPGRATAGAMAVHQHAYREDEQDDDQEGLDTPAKVFATEDTPGFFSRADSESSLDLIGDDVVNAAIIAADPAAAAEDENREEKGQLEVNHSEKRSTEEAIEPSSGPVDVDDEESTDQERELPDGSVLALPPMRTVHFNNRPQETPMISSRVSLRSSRTSSQESLDSFDQQSFKGGYSSCDFSCAPSGRVSPSDLPDSPCATPPAERRERARLAAAATARTSQQQQQGFLAQPRKPLESTTAAAATIPLPTSSTTAALSADAQTRPAVTTAFSSISCLDDDEEAPKIFNEEGTPAGNFSSATSLSKLTIESDEDEPEQVR